MLTIGKDPAVDDRSAAVAPRERRQLVGNRWALAGAIIYLLEWVAIAGWLGALVGINGGGVQTTSSSTASDIFRQYSHAGTAAAIALGAGWFALVLLTLVTGDLIFWWLAPTRIVLWTHLFVAVAVLPALGGGDTRFQPLWIEDLVTCIVASTASTFAGKETRVAR